MQLKEVQKRFKDHIVSIGTLEDDREFSSQFVHNEIVLDDRFSVYRNNVLKGLGDVLADTYPVVEKLVGEAFFRNMAWQYIRKNLPEQACLIEYGATFVQFIETFDPARSLPYLGDVARMEWAWQEAYYAVNDGVLDVALLRDVPQEDFENLVFSFRPSVRFVESDFPLFEIRDFCLQDNPEGQLDVDQGNARLMIYRPARGVQIVKLEQNEYSFLKHLYAGDTTAIAAETILAGDPDFDLTEILQKHFELESFSGLKIKR